MSVLRRLKVPGFNAEGSVVPTAAGYAIDVRGLVRDPKTLPLADLRALPRSEVDARLTSVSGFSVRARWGGVLWTDFEPEAVPLPAATHVTFSSPGGYDTTVPLAELRNPRVLLAWLVDGEEIEPEYGGPLRLIVPHLWGYKSCKWVVTIEFGDRMRGGFWEDRGYPADAQIRPGMTADLNDGGRRKPLHDASEPRHF